LPWRGAVAEYEDTGVRFPTLGIAAWQWIETHCVIPDGPWQGDAFRLTDEMVKFLLHFYRVDPDSTSRTGGPRFVHERGGQYVRPQKHGKGPFSSAIICFEASGPAVPDGFDEDGVLVGRPWDTPLIQVTAISEDQTANVFRALVPMIQLGPLAALMPDTGETRINLPGGGRIEPVTASARSRLGQRLTFSVQDETHSWTERAQGIRLADNQRRNLAGMGGRFLETTNAWDISEGSVAQLTNENPVGVYVDYPTPIAGSIRNKAERRKAIRHAYGDSIRTPASKAWKPWVELERIEIEIEALMQRDPAQAERFFLNRAHAGESVAFDLESWAACANPEAASPDGATIVLGVDGALTEDALAIVATDVATYHSWIVHMQEVPTVPPKGYSHDLDLADEDVRAVFERFDVWRMYADYQRIEDVFAAWTARWTKDRVVPWLTNRTASRAVGNAVRAFTVDVAQRKLTHDDDPRFNRHIANSRRKALGVRDEDDVPMWTIQKDRPHSPNKIDAAMAAVISSEARRDAIAAGVLNRRRSVFVGL
jgi:hypothetical protein